VRPAVAPESSEAVVARSKKKSRRRPRHRRRKPGEKPTDLIVETLPAGVIGDQEPGPQAQPAKEITVNRKTPDDPDSEDNLLIF
ncbi:MAG: hypothetical protein CVU53_03425, partial [Deltaproteobacteria bacterium HGW-Deltaproteobacteria-11]